MKFIPVILLFFIAFTSQAQQLSQFNTGTLFDSFENPAQRAFIPDSSRQFAFNFFIPNFGANGGSKGNGENSIRSLINNGTYNSSGLTPGLQNRNYAIVGANTYWFMLKMYRRLDSDQEIGISAQTKAEGRGIVTDETLLLLDSYKNLDNGTLNTDLLNGEIQGQSYHQFNLTFRQKIAPATFFGIKLSALLGMYYYKLDITHSNFSVENNASLATLFLQGKFLSSYNGTFGKRDTLGYRNPGAAVSFSLQTQLENGIVVQGNIKDLGFIRWSGRSVTSDFSGTEDVDRINVAGKNDSRILTEKDSIINKSKIQSPFIAPIDGKADISFYKKSNVFTADFYDTPTLVISKNLFYNGFTAALINHFTYKNLWFTALASYNNYQSWNAGLQLMVKSPNAEFFLGTEQLFKSTRFFNTNTADYHSTGINAFLGFSVKFGRIVEHSSAATYVPIGEPKGFFDEVWRRIFKPASSY